MIHTGLTMDQIVTRTLRSPETANDQDSRERLAIARALMRAGQSHALDALCSEPGIAKSVRDDFVAVRNSMRSKLH